MPARRSRQPRVRELDGPSGRTASIAAPTGSQAPATGIIVERFVEQAMDSCRSQPRRSTVRFELGPDGWPKAVR